MTQNLVINTSVTSGAGSPAITEQVNASYVSGQTINQVIVLKPGHQYASPVGFSTMSLTPSGPVLLVAAKGTDPSYINQTVNQQATIDDTVDSFQITNPSTTATVSVRMIFVVAIGSTPPITGYVVSVNGKSGIVTLTATDITGFATVATSGNYNDLLNRPSPYVLPVATSSVLGGVKQGAGTAVDNNGVLSLVPATSSVLGGVKQGANITIASDGTISAPNPYALPVATSSVLGGVKQGANVTIAGDGTISVGAPYTLPIATSTIVGGVKQGPGTVIGPDGTLSTVMRSVAGRTGDVVLAVGDVNDAASASALLAGGGAALVGTSEGPNVQQTLDTLGTRLTTSLRNITLVCTSVGQTVYPVSGGYPIGLIDLYALGAHLTNGDDYAATDGANIVVTSAIAARIPVGAKLLVRANGSFVVADAVDLATLGGTNGANLVGYGTQTVKQALDAAVATLASLANQTDPTQGASLVGWDNGNITSYFLNHVQNQIPTFAQLAAVDVTKYLQCFVQGYWTKGDGGHSSWVYSASTAHSSANGTTIVASSVAAGCWLMLYDRLFLRPCGATSSLINTTAAVTLNSPQITVSSAGDFVNGQPITLYQAGIPSVLAAPTGLGVTQTGTPGTTSRTYAVIALDPNGGCSPASTQIVTSTSSATLSSTNYDVLTWTAVSGASEYGIYDLAVGFLGLSQTTTFNNQGYGAIGVNYLPSAPPTSAIGATLYTTLVSGAGTTTWTLATSALSTVASAYVAHDDTNAVVNALAATPTVYAEVGTFRTRQIQVNGKQLLGSGKRQSIFYGSDKTKSVIKAWNIHTVRDLSIQQSNFTVFDAWPNCDLLELGDPISNTNSERTSEVRNIFLNNGCEGLSARATVYSNIIENLEFARVTSPVHMVCPSATGNIMKNFYVDAWDQYPTTKLTVKNGIWLEGSWNEVSMEQINVEWANLVANAILVNGADAVELHNLHFEGLTIQGNPTALIGFLANGGARPLQARVSAVSVVNVQLASSSKGVALATVNTNTNLTIDNCSNASGGNNLNGGSSWRFYRTGSVSASQNPIIDPKNINVDIFANGDFLPVSAGLPAIVRSQIPFIDSAPPSVGTYSNGSVMINKGLTANSFGFWIKNATGWSQYAPEYDTGTFTTTVQGSTTAGTFSYNAGNCGGWYSKVGGKVYFGGRVQLTSSGGSGAAGDAQIVTTIPYLPANSLYGYGAVTIGQNTGLTLTAGFSAYMLPNSGLITLTYNNGTGNVPVSAFGNNALITFSGHFSVE